MPLDLIDEARGVNLELDRGDIAIFGGFTPHRSAPNRSDRWRRQLYLSYNKRPASAGWWRQSPGGIRGARP